MKELAQVVFCFLRVTIIETRRTQTQGLYPHDSNQKLKSFPVLLRELWLRNALSLKTKNETTSYIEVENIR